MTTKNLRLALLLLAIVQIGFTKTARANPFEYTWQELAPGVWAGIRQDPFELPQEGNSVFVITEQGVVVFDAGGSPLMGESIVAKIRSLTEKPITHVIISHWHGDHMRGLQAIQAASPNVTIFAHPFSRDFIAATQERWLKRRVSMVPNIRKALDAALAENHDLKGRPLIPQEKTWLLQGQSIVDQLDRENHRTTYVVPNATFTDRMVLYLGGRELQFLHLGNAHTAGDVILWLPQEKIVATGDIVTAPIPLMPNAYSRDYAGVLQEIKALGFKTLVPGHGLVQHDTAYVDLLSETFRLVSAQMKSLIARSIPKDEAITKIDYSSVESRFTHGDPFLTNRFHDYLSAALAEATYLIESGAGIKEEF
jgi:glyoxylase-like metal-dependent hydrolase (beta-lactamase superfamily II)